MLELALYLPQSEAQFSSVFDAIATAVIFCVLFAGR